jgi:uncharacterized protein YcbK (DUF882 family)
MTDATAPRLSRRPFLLGLSLLPALGLVTPVRAARAPERQLVLHHQHTGESLRTVYFADGAYLEDSLRAINRIMRDWRNDQVAAIDPRLLDIVHLLQGQLELKGPLEIACGYRSPQTNAMLRRRSRGVAKNSLHMQGMAVDIMFDGRTLAAVQKAAVALGAGGVGYYPGSGFIHLDTGPVRQWAMRGRVAAGSDGGSSRVARRNRARRQAAARAG